MVKPVMLMFHPAFPQAFTMERVISSLEPSALELMLQEVAKLFRQKLTDDIIAIDGKTLRGSRGKAHEKKGVHLLHAWSCDNRVCLAQLKVDDKSNEITAICTLLDQLFIEGSIITTDALNTQKSTVRTIGIDTNLVYRGREDQFYRD